MKKLSWVNKLVFIFNALLALLLLISYIVPYISPQKLPLLSLLSLAVPVLILSNIGFMLYWLIKLRKQFLTSFIVLLIGFNTVTSFFRISEKQVLLNDDLKVMSYNVRLFNLYNWKPESTDTIRKNIVDFVHEKSPDVVCFQEFVNEFSRSFNYKYKFVNNKNSENQRIRFGQAIYSKHKIINTGAINFKSKTNNAIYADIVKQKDTFRVYNVHLESQKIQLDQENLGEQDTEKLRKRLQTTFKKQADQVKLLIKNEKQCNYRTIICGDFNNTAFSWVYNQLKGNKNDAFVEAGNGFGKSYDYMLPARIDFILPHEDFTVNNFKNYFIEYSDHYPIMARLNLNE